MVHIATGPCAGQVGCIVDIIDAKRFLVDGPSMLRCEIKLKDMFLTRILLPTGVKTLPNGEKVKDRTISPKTLMALWSSKLVDERYKRTTHAQRLEKKAKREACTDYEFFKVRVAARQINKIVENSVKNLTEKYPRAMAKMERKRRIDMGVALGYRQVKKLTPEEKAVKEAREKIIRENRKVKSQIAYELKKKARAKRAEVNKARIAKKKEKNTLKVRKPLAKDESGKNIRKSNENKTPTTPHVSSVKLFRRARDADRKEKATRRRVITKSLQENRAAIKKAVSAGTKPPRKLSAKTIQPKRSTQKKQIKKSQEAKVAAAAAATS